MVPSLILNRDSAQVGTRRRERSDNKKEKATIQRSVRDPSYWTFTSTHASRELCPVPVPHPKTWRVFEVLGHRQSGAHPRYVYMTHRHLIPSSLPDTDRSILVCNDRQPAPSHRLFRNCPFSASVVFADLDPLGVLSNFALPLVTSRRS